jgi:hypothetical protein
VDRSGAEDGIRTTNSTSDRLQSQGMPQPETCGTPACSSNPNCFHGVVKAKRFLGNTQKRLEESEASGKRVAIARALWEWYRQRRLKSSLPSPR